MEVEEGGCVATEVVEGRSKEMGVWSIVGATGETGKMSVSSSGSSGS